MSRVQSVTEMLPLKGGGGRVHKVLTALLQSSHMAGMRLADAFVCRIDLAEQ